MNRLGAFTFPAKDFHILRYQEGTKLEVVLRDNPKVLAALDGPMFGHTGSGRCGHGPWDTCYRLYDASKNLDEPSNKPNSGMTVSVVGGSTVPNEKDVVAPGASVAVQLSLTLVWEGRNVASHERFSSGAGMGIHHNGTDLVFLVGGAGTMHDLADEFIAHGCTYAGYTDGGSSTTLYTRERGFLGANARNVKIPTWLVAEPRDGTVTSYVGKLILGGAAVLVGLLVGSWLLKS